MEFDRKAMTQVKSSLCGGRVDEIVELELAALFLTAFKGKSL
jgi:hypothetical protein